MGGAALNIGPDAVRNITEPNALPLAEHEALIRSDSPVRVDGQIRLAVWGSQVSVAGDGYKMTRGLVNIA